MPLSFASCEILSVARRGIAKAAAYGERRVLADEDGTVLYRPRRHDDAVAAFTLMPKGAAPRFADPHTLWDAVERRGRSGRSRVVGLAIVLGLPREDELTLPECIVPVRRFAEILHRDRLPVRVDIHRVCDGDGHVLHRHAHLTLGLYPVEGDTIGRVLDRRWLPVVRGRLVHALDWSSIWARVQTEFFRERDLDLAVPPASGLSEPKVAGRPKRGTKAALAGRNRKQARDEVRGERTRLVVDPAAVLRILTRNRTIVSKAELDAVLASAGHQPEAVTDLAAAVLAHEDCVDLSPGGQEAAGERPLTGRGALERAASILSGIEGMEEVSATVVRSPSDMLAELREVVAGVCADPASARHLVVIWSDSALRCDLEGAVPWPRRCRRIAARHLSDLDRRDATVLRWSPTTMVLVVSADRLDDVEIEILVQRASQAGAGLRLGVVLDGPIPRAERGIAPMLLERVLSAGLPLARDNEVSSQILRQRLSWRGEGRVERSTQSEAPAVLICSDRQDRRPPPPPGHARDGERSDTIGAADLLESTMTPRQAWAAMPPSATVLVRSASDWLWAAPLLRQYPHLHARFEIDDDDNVFVEAVIRQMDETPHALRRLIEPMLPATPESAAPTVVDPSPSSDPADPAEARPDSVANDERDGLDLDTDLDTEAAAEAALELDPVEHRDADADDDGGADHHEPDSDQDHHDGDHQHDDDDRTSEFLVSVRGHIE